jgi:hypothetical protein
MVAGKLLVLAMRPGAGVVKSLLVGSEMEEALGLASCAGSAFWRASDAIANTVRENRVKGPPRVLVCDRRKRKLVYSGSCCQKKEPGEN